MTQNITTSQAVRFDNAVSASTGKEYTLLSTVPGNTGKPEFNEYVPAHVREDGKAVDARFTTTLFVNEQLEDGKRTHKFRINLWGALADAASRHMDGRVAKIRLIGAVQSTYRDKWDGVERVSYSVNSERQIEVVEIKRPEGSAFEAAGSAFDAAAGQSAVPF